MTGVPIDIHDLAAVTHQPGAVISSPYFPTLCSRDLIKQHMIRCESMDQRKIKKDDDQCMIRILFTDFQIGMMSRMEVFFFFPDEFIKQQILYSFTTRPAI